MNVLFILYFTSFFFIEYYLYRNYKDDQVLAMIQEYLKLSLYVDNFGKHSDKYLY